MTHFSIRHFSGRHYSMQHFAGMISAIIVSIGVIGPPESDAKCVVYVSRNVAEIWAGDYRSMSVASNQSNFDVAPISISQWQPAEREIMVESRGAQLLVDSSNRVVLVQADDHAAIAGLDYPVEAHAKDVLYIQSLFRLAMVGGKDREIMVSGCSRVINVPIEEEVTA